MGIVQGNSTSTTIDARGIITILYSTTSGTSKSAAEKFAEKLQNQLFIPQIINIGDYPHDDFLSYEGTIVLFLSTYGDGDSPADGQKFRSWIEKIQPNKSQFQAMQYALMAFGNSSFEHHCGFGRLVDKILKNYGAHEMVELTECDASNKESNIDAKLQKWADSLITTLKHSHPIKPYDRGLLGSPYQATQEVIKDFDWEVEASKQNNYSQQFLNFHELSKCKVIHVKQLRKDASDGRSTLWVRIENHPSLKLTPACNVTIFPENIVEGFQEEKHRVVKFNEVKGKIPFPALPLIEFRKIIDFTQIATNRQIKNAIFLSTGTEQVINSYSDRIKNKLEIKVSLKHLVEDLKPKHQFYTSLSLNHVRTYTLASWEKDQKYIDLCVSLVKNGLTSNYLKSKPEYLRMNSFNSAFYIPENRPLILIANGSGIAPFRSIVQYYANLPEGQRPFIRLYYGIQNSKVDFYFEEDWIEYQANKIIEIKLAESRSDPANKQYVQDVLEKDVDFLHQHLFTNNGVVFICGGEGMSKAVYQVLFKAYTKECKLPYKAFSLGATLKQKRTVVEEVFG